MHPFMVQLALASLLAGSVVLGFPLGKAWGDEPVLTRLDNEELGSYEFAPVRGSTSSGRTQQRGYYHTPAMIGDFFAGSPLHLRGNTTFDSLLVWANDLDVSSLPGANSTLSLSEAGPVGIYASSLVSVQQLQALLRAGSPVPGLDLVGVVNDSAVLITLDSVSQIQNQLTSTAEAFDLLAIAPPPGSYDAAVLAAFLARNAAPGLLVYRAERSGALQQGGGDTLQGGEDLDAFYFYDYALLFDVAMADATSGGVGRLKIAEGGTVLPQDRVFMRYSHISGLNFANDRAPLNRFVPGFEKTFLGGLISVELRAPFATDALTASTLAGQSLANGSSTRFGNLTAYLKTLLIERQRWCVSGGLGMALPTASDLRVNYHNGTPLLVIENEAVRLQPFLAGLYAPDRDWFAHAFLQYDVAANGNSVSMNTAGTGLSGAGLSGVGTLTDTSNLFFDAGLGYWLYRSDSHRGLTAVIPTVEVHQNSLLNQGNALKAGVFQIGNFSGQTSLTHVTAGSTFEFARRSQLAVAYTGPIGGGADRPFNGGLQLHFSRGW